MADDGFELESTPPPSPMSPGHQQLYQRHLAESKYEREDVQKKTFGKWINSQLVKVNFSLVTDLFYDLRDGTRLLALLSVLTGRTYKPEKGHMRVHHLNNVSTAFRLLDKHNVKLVNISSNDIVDGNPKLTLGLVWSIILNWQVQDVLKGSMAELQQSSLDRTLLVWCQEATKDYADVCVSNFTTSWSDGLAFSALIHRFRPDLFDYDIASRKAANARLDYAFRIANKHLGIARLLDPEDVNTSTPDKKSIMMYVMCLYQALPHTKIPLVPTNGASFSGGAAASPDAAMVSQPSGTDQVDFTAYQALMEEVLVWLLAAEDHLDTSSSLQDDLSNLKEQFHKHEEFLLELTKQQGSVGAVLQEGTRLLKESHLNNEEAEEIHIQMRLLNSRWDQLRTKAMDRQARIHESLTKLQQEQLERLRQWLTATEDRISQLGAAQQPESAAAAVRMLEDHELLQKDLEAKQEYVNALSDIVVIVDESAGDNCSQMEDQLSALGERWSHVCQWAEQRAVGLEQLANHWEQLEADLKKIKSWLATHEHSLRLIEANPSTDRNQMMDVARQLQLLERDMEPHVQRLSQLQEGVQRLPALIQAAVLKEKSKRIVPKATYKCVDRLSSDLEDLEDRIEALDGIMEAQRQRLSKSGLDMKVVALPPDITTSLTVFGSTDLVNMQSGHEEENSTTIKKRKLDSDWHSQYEQALRAVKQHLEQMEQLLNESESSSTSLDEQRHLEQKPLLDQVLKSGHLLIDALQDDTSEIAEVEEGMSSMTERWLLVEELLKQKNAQQQVVIQQQLLVQDHENSIDTVLSNPVPLSLQEEKNDETLNKLRTDYKIATDCPNEQSDSVLEPLKEKIALLKNKMEDFEKDMLMLKQLKKESESLDKWMEEVRSFLTAEDVGWGDVDVLEAQLEQSNALQADVKTLEPSVINIKRVVSVLALKVDDVLKEELDKISQRLDTTWINVVADALEKNSQLKNALDLTRRTLDGITSIDLLLDELQVDIPPTVIINSTSELSQTLRKLNTLKNRVDTKVADYRSVVDAGNAVVANANVNEELKNKFNQLNCRWNDIAGAILERQRALKAASHHYGEFKVLTAQECDWQDKLDKKLTRSTTMAADAEEISEELDDLENYMKNRPKARILRIESMGNELVSLNIMADSVGLEVRTLTERWSSLEEKAKAKAEWLENRVRGAQQCEQRLVQLHSCINSIDAELCASLEHDLYADELPELCQRLSQDIAQQEQLLTEIRSEELGYEAEGRKEAANRLHEQLSFIEATLQDVRNKFRKFQNPSELEPRLERMLRVLRDLEQSMCYIELASDDCEAIEGQLNNCIRFYASLSDIKAEVEAVLRDGRQQVEEGLLDDPITVSSELDAMKALYNRLGEQVAVARETLERALQLSYQLNMELNSTSEWLNNLVTEIHNGEGPFTDQPNPIEELRIYKKFFKDLCDNQGKMDSIRESYDAFCALCDPALLDTLRERVEDMHQEWQRIMERLKNKIADLKEETGDDQNEDSNIGDEAEGAASADQQQQQEEEKQMQNGDNVPVRMYRSVVLTSVRQFTDPESPTIIQNSPLLEVSTPTRIVEVDPMDIPLPKEDDIDENGDEKESVELKEEISSQSTPAEDFGYFNAAFDDDFDEQEEEVCKPIMTFSKVRALEVVRGEVNVFNEEDEEMASSTSSSSSDSSSSSSEPSESGSVKNLALERKEEENSTEALPAVDDNSIHSVFEVHAAQLPSPELPSMEILNSRPITPEDILASEEEVIEVVAEPVQVVNSQDTLAESPSAEHQFAMEQVMKERFSVEQMPTVTLDPTSRSDSPFGMRTPPPTPAHDELTASPHSPSVSHSPCHTLTIIKEQADNPPEQVVVESAVVTADQPVTDSNLSSVTVVSEETETDVLIAETDVSVQQQQHDEKTTVVSVRSSRKVSRDEGTQTDLSGFPGRVHASSPSVANEQPTEHDHQHHTSITQQKTIPLQVEEQEETSRTTPDLVAEAKQDELPSPVSPDSEDVFIETVDRQDEEKDRDDDSFYGSDKEVDGEVEFSHTDTSPSGASSSESDAESTMRAQVKRESVIETVQTDKPLEEQVTDFNREVALMLQRIDQVVNESQSPVVLNGEMEELALLEPDLATLISRGDSLVLQVQTLDMDWALQINATTAELRAGRSSLKASHEVRRQRQAEQELTLKECQQQTEQLQLWLSDIARTLDNATRVNDQSQLQSLEEELNRRQADIRQLNEAAGRLQEQQVLEYRALIGSLTLRWKELHRQFLVFQGRPEESDLDKEEQSRHIMGGPDFVSRVNKLREAIASVSRQLHSPPLTLKHYEQLSGQEDSVKAVKTALYTLKGDVDTYNRQKDEAVETAPAAEQKEQIQRVLDKLMEEWALLNRTYTDKQAGVQQSLATWRSLHADMKDFEDWLGATEGALVSIQGDGLNRTERKNKLKELESQVTARHKVVSTMTSTCREVGAECSTADAILLREKQDVLGKRWRALLSGLASVRQRLTSLDGSPASVAKLTPLVLSSPPSPATRQDETQGASESQEPQTPPLTASTLVASLDKSILQIRDWLTVLETMLKQQATVAGDSDDVLQLLEKQKNVLRELEQKKPQLDHLVDTAESIKDGGPTPPIGSRASPAQVSKLREHWEDTAAAVTSRRNQLEDLLNDSNQFERRRQDVDQWLGRMENRMAKLAPVAATADLIDAQHREQKVIQSEIQQYKGQMDQLVQMTDRLVASYPHDDTSRVVRSSDNIAQRYNALHSGANARGRALNSAMGSLANYDRSLDRFVAWLSDTESSLESLELELDSYGPGVKTSRERVLTQLKELSVELDGRREEQTGLAASGQRLINSLSDGSSSSHGGSSGNGGGGSGGGGSNDDALMLRRRLDDMNRRWHGLRAKTVAIRNRLENNTEHWSALLLSLRELVEWVIRKDTELTGLGPIRADLSTLLKQQDDFRAFRRQLDDKRPLIEQSILTGRQLVASESSDASDSEATTTSTLPGDSRGYRSAEEAARELTHGIRREGTKLAERWAALRDRTDRWNMELDSATRRVQQLQSCMEDASNRLMPAETARSQWISPTDLSPPMIQEQLDQLKELSDKIAPVQLIVEEVNDQATQLADSGVPLSHANLARLDDLNSRWKVLQSSLDDRYQQLCGASRDGALTGTLLHSFLASSVERPWERSVTEADVPYYVNHQTETTQWDHPQLEELMNSLSELNDVRFSAYRMALKLRSVQKFLCLDKLELSAAIDTFDAHGLRAQNDKVIDIPDMVTVLRSLYESILMAHPGAIRLQFGIDLCLNWILNVYDSQRSGEIRVLSFKVIVTLMSRGHLEEKYRYLFRLIADPNRLVDAPKLGVLLHDCVQIPRELGEVAAFGGSNIEPSVKSCFEKAGKQRQSIEAVHFLAWMKREPQSVVWLPVLHRLAASESARHQSKCNVCKTTPIIGLRYRCLKCLSFDMCQSCFFTGRVSKSHKLNHPMQEYCTATTSGEDIKDFTRTLRNKFKSKRYFKKHPRLGYLPVQTALEGAVTPSDMQSEMSSSQIANSSTQDVTVHSAATSMMDGIHKDGAGDSEDEHQLIAKYCRALNGELSGSSAPRSPIQVLAALDSDHKEEIETMIRELEEENATLQAEYERLRSQQSPSMSFSFSSSPDDGTTPIPHQHTGASAGGNGSSDIERDMLAEARLLRQHKTRLESRMKILEEHNRQLETQLGRLRQLLDEPGSGSSPAKTGTLQTRAVTAAHLATDTPVRGTNGFGHDSSHSWAENKITDRLENRPPPPPHASAQNVGNLHFMAGDLGQAVSSLVNAMTDPNDHSPLTDEEN